MVVPNHDGLPDCREVGDYVLQGPLTYFDHVSRAMDSVGLHRAATGHFLKVMEVARQAGGNPLPTAPKEPTPAEAVLCARLILEEALETVAALGVEVKVIPEHVIGTPITFEGLLFKSVAPADLVQTIDGCCDTRVVSTFTMVLCGVTDHVPQTLVDDNNLAKFEPGKGGYRDPETGKWIKPPGHPKPAIREALIAQGWKPPESSSS
jgi:predicted HAD superfamily Cof-like phosphohydrolase